MAIAQCGHFVAFALLCAVPALCQQVGDVTIRPLKRGGVVVSIPNIPKMNFFEFQGNVNNELEFGDSGDISVSVSKPNNGFWTGIDDKLMLNVGDVIHYYVHVGIKGQRGFDKKNLSYTVKELFDSANENTPTPTSSTTESVDNRNLDTDITTKTTTTTTSPPPAAACRKSLTEINSRMAVVPTICSGQIIFEDNFDHLREDLWTVEHYIPSKPEYPFVSYQTTSVSVSDGMLRIQPRLLETLEGFDSVVVETGRLDLTMGCTRPGSCVHQSNGPQILHPIVSGRVTSNNAFAFKYGFIEIRAKVPQGDWLYPDILLETLSKAYGVEDYRALRIAGVRGNKQLVKGTEELGNQVLYGGPMLDNKCRNNLLVNKKAATEWGNDFHVYSVSWVPDMITLFVDNEEWGRVQLTPSDLQTRLPKNDKTCEPLRKSLQNRMINFKDFFGITLGVSAGGIFEFPDKVISGMTMSKPWSNTESRAMLKFYQANNTWIGTWDQPSLLVDYVKVRAL